MPATVQIARMISCTCKRLCGGNRLLLLNKTVGAHLNRCIASNSGGAKPLCVLGIETTCDETGAAVIRGTLGTLGLIAEPHRIFSQMIV